MEKSYCQFPNSGGSWISFPEPEEDDESEGENNNDLESRHATLLRRNEMQLFGHCPAHDNFCLVTCKECGKILKMSVFTQHCEHYHRHILSSIPSHKSHSDVKRNKNIKVMQPKVMINKLNTIKMESMDVDSIEVKIEEVPPVIPKVNNLIVPETVTVTSNSIATNHALKKAASLKKVGKDSPRKFLLTKDREYDPNRHCGVWIEEMRKNCTRSLTCKTHALSLRRAVPGRIKEFDILLLEHRERVNLAKEQQQLLCKAQSFTSSPAGSSSGNKFSDQRNGLASQSFSGGGQLNKDVVSSLAFKSQHSNLDDHQSDLQYLNVHPKPLACCKFGVRRAGPGHFVFNRRSDHLRTTVLSMVERLLHPSQSRQTLSKHSVHRRYNTKTAGQSTSQGSSMKTDTPIRSRTAPTGVVPTSSTVFRNSNKQKTSRQTSSERNSQTSRNLKPAPSTNTVQATVPTSQQAQRLLNAKGPAMKDSCATNVRNTTGNTCGAVITTELESSLTLGKDLGIADPATVSVILNGPIGSGDLLTNHIQTSGASSKSCSQSPSPRGSYVIPVSPSSPAPGVYTKNNQVVNSADSNSGAVATAMSPPTVFQRQSSTGSQQLGPLVNGTASSPPGAGVKGYATNLVPNLSNNTKGISSSVGHSLANFSQGQTVVFANTNISQLQGQPISQPLSAQITQDKTHGQNNLFQRPLASPGRASCQPPSPQIPSPGRQSPQRSPSNVSPKYQQHSLYLNHQHVPVSTQAPIAQLKQQVENQGQQLQQIKFQQLQQQQSHNPPRQQQTDQSQALGQQPLQHHKQQSPQYRAQQRIAPAPIQPTQQTTYLLQQSQPNHTLSLRPANGQVLKTSNTVFITNDNPPREIQFSLSRNSHAANTVG